MACNPYDLDQFTREQGEARDQRREEAADRRVGHADTIPPARDLTHWLSACRFRDAARSIIAERDYFASRATGTHWAWQTNPERQEIRDIFKAAAEALGPAIALALEAQRLHEAADEELKFELEEHRS